MGAILDFIMLHYTWLLVGAIIILLAIIGYYADKTNFGLGKENNKIEDDNLDIDETVVNDGVLEEAQQETIQEENKTEVTDDTVSNVVENVANESLEEKFERFDKEFEEILPQKDIIDDELLDEIDSLSLDKTQKINLSDIPDLDDVELPEIKELKPETEDIWKF